MMMVSVNGVYREATTEEVRENEANQSVTPEPDPMEAMQAQLDENTLAIAEILYGGDAL